MKMLFIRFADHQGNVNDGGAIFDNRLLEALNASGAEVEVEEVARQKSYLLPMWSSKIERATIRRVAQARREGRKIILSHEALFKISHHVPVDALIVHNYFVHFTFHGRTLLEQYYRTGSSRFYSKAFAATQSAFFISHREHRLALMDFPMLSGRSDICIPPPRPVRRDSRSDVVLHLSGSEAWLPKKLSGLSPQEMQILTDAGYQVTDLDPPVTPAFALINDRFEVGFKLKLAQMLHSRDVIASFCDLSEEIQQTCPGHPFYKQVKSVAEAIAFFREISEEFQPHQIDACYARLEEDNYLPTWDDLASRLIQLVARPI